MKLNAQMRAVTKTLILPTQAAESAFRGRWNIERISMPLKCVDLEVFAGKFARGKNADAIPTFLDVGVARNPCAQHFRHQLSAEADPQDGRGTREKIAQKMLFLAKPRIKILVVDVHLAAQDDHPFVGKRLRKISAGRLQNPKRNPARAAPFKRGARPGVGFVLNDQNSYLIVHLYFSPISFKWKTFTGVSKKTWHH